MDNLVKISQLVEFDGRLVVYEDGRAIVYDKNDQYKFKRYEIETLKLKDGTLHFQPNFEKEIVG